MITQPRTPATAYGTDTFAAHLAAREAALGIAPIAQELHKNIPQPGGVTADASAPDAAPHEPNMGDMGTAGHSETMLSPAEDARRRWGIVATSAPRLDGAYTFTCRTWDPGGRVVYVCGSPAAHVAAGHWRLDRRMERGQGYICAMCWCYESGLYGIVGR